MTDQFNWSAPTLDPEDQRLLDAYVEVGRSLDFLAYSDDFIELCRRAGRPDDQRTLHQTYLRLLTLRKQGRLPRLFASLSAD